MTTRATHGLVDLIDGYLQVPEVTAPGTPGSAKVRIYAKSDGHLYIKDDAGTEYDLTAALNGVTAASVLADNEVPKIDGASRAVQASNVFIEDISGPAMHIHGPNNASPFTPTNVVLRSGNATGGTVNSGDAYVDVGTSGGGTPGIVGIGTTTAESVNIGRSSKNTEVKGTLASGAHTMAEQAAPSTPAAGYVVIYPKSDGLMYSKDDAGAETALGGGGGGGVRTVSAQFGGPGGSISASDTVWVRVPYTGTITKVSLLADATGSIVIDVWKDTYANYPPTVADTIAAAAKPTLSSANKSEDSTLTGWTTAVTAGDVLKFNVDSVSGLTQVALLLEITV